MKKYIEEKYVFSKDVDSNLHGEDVFFRFEDEDIKKEEWQPKHFQSIQISEYNYRELDRLVDEVLYLDSMRLEL